MHISLFVYGSLLFFLSNLCLFILYLDLVLAAVPEIDRPTGKSPNNAPYGQPILGAGTYVMSSIIHKWQW